MVYVDKMLSMLSKCHVFSLKTVTCAIVFKFANEHH